MLDIIIPIYNEENLISNSINTIDKILNENNIKHSFILIDDGSSDNCWNKMSEMCSIMNNITCLKFSRNFGKESAICAGLINSNADACIVMDCDLQHPPELIPKMYDLWKNEGYEVVEAVKSNRGKEPVLNKTGSFLFYRLFKKLSGFNLENASDFKLLDKKVIEVWKSFSEHNTFFRGLSIWSGFKRTSLYFEVPKRENGQSKWSGFKLFKLAINAISSFSSAPLQIISGMGIIFFISAIILAIQTLIMKIQGKAASGFTTVILLLLIIGSSIMISLGIIGTYISRIFDEVKNRPRYIISEIKNGGKKC